MVDGDQRALGRLEGEVDNLQNQIGAMTRMVEGQSNSLNEFRSEVREQSGRTEERLAAHIAEDERRFGVIDQRFTGTNGKIADLAGAFADHEMDDADGGNRRRSGRGMVATAGVGAGAGALALWNFLRSLIEGNNQGGG